MRHGLIWILLALWAVAVAMSVLATLEPPTGDGFTRGLNRVTGLLQFQALALLIGLVILALRGRAEGLWLRRLMLVPVFMALALLLGIAGVFLYASMVPL
jgi:hypothetical protein